MAMYVLGVYSWAHCKGVVTDLSVILGVQFVASKLKSDYFGHRPRKPDNPWFIHRITQLGNKK